MCGITGKIYFDRQRPMALDELTRMTDSLRHRGPDDAGHYIKDNVGLGFRRLSIIDLQGGHQPLSNADGHLWITFNGEIYNFKELRTDLEKQGYTFKTKSDTEVIVHLYQAYGEKCVDYLRGMFAFVIYDQRKRTLFGARDRFGIKPFFYAIDKDSFVYGSEIKAIRVAGCDKALNLQALDSYFAYGYTPSEQSVYAAIHKLPPAHYFTLNTTDSSSFTIKSYWQVHFEPDYGKTESYWRERLLETFDEAVKMRMISDVPLGAFLSGGIDSGSVVALMARHATQPVKTFSIGFKEAEFNELPYARQLARQYNTEHHELIVEPESFELLPRLVRAYDEPFADSSAIPTYYVSKFAREYVTVTLSGDGGDELFAGYHSYTKMMGLKRNPLNRLFFNKYLFKPVNHLWPEHWFGKGYSYYLSKNSAFIGAYFCIWKDYERRRLFRDDVAEALGAYRSEAGKVERLHHSAEYEYLSRMQKLDMETYLVDDILTKVDRASMMNSLESRVPLLDHKLAELSFKIPAAFKWQAGNKKAILKKTMAPFLPRGVLAHKKRGFGIPLKQWFRDDLKAYTAAVLNDPQAPLFEYLNYSTVNTMFTAHQKGVRTFGGQIWSLLFFNEWLKQNL